MIAVHFENLLFLLFIVVAMLFQLLARAASKASKDSGQTRRRSTSTPRIPQRPDETDEERVRKFLEALGQPTTSEPPPPVATRPTYQEPIVLPHRSPLKSPLPPLTTRPPDLPRDIKLPGQITPTREKGTFRPRPAEAPGFEVHEGPTLTEPSPIIETPAEAYAIATQPIVRPEQTETKIAALLRSASGLRNAIILREIFGPPRSLQPLDLIGSV